MPERQPGHLPQAAVQARLAALLHGEPGREGAAQREAHMQGLHRRQERRKNRCVAVAKFYSPEPMPRCHVVAIVGPLAAGLSKRSAPEALLATPCNELPAALLQAAASCRHAMAVCHSTWLLNETPQLCYLQIHEQRDLHPVEEPVLQGGGSSSTAARAPSSAPVPCAARRSTKSRGSSTPSRRCQEVGRFPASLLHTADPAATPNIWLLPLACSRG